MACPGSLSDLSRETEGFKYDNWEGYTVVNDGFDFNLYNPSLDPGESQKDLTWPNQELNQIYQSLENQCYYESQQGLASTKAGTSDSGSKKGSENPLVTHQLRISGKAQVSNERKKENDKRYREKCRERKKKTECELDQLRRECTIFHDENKKLKKSLELANTETSKLNAEVRNLRSNTTNQGIFVDSFLKKLLQELQELFGGQETIDEFALNSLADQPNFEDSPILSQPSQRTTRVNLSAFNDSDYVAEADNDGSSPTPIPHTDNSQSRSNYRKKGKKRSVVSLVDRRSPAPALVVDPIVEIRKDISHLRKIPDIANDEELTDFAIIMLEKKENRDFFLGLEDDDFIIRWIKRKFNQTGGFGPSN